MRKYVIGALVGALLTVGVTASADAISQVIGKKVGGVMSVSVDGKALGKEAVIIDGVSYLPVRDAAEALGSEVTGVKDRHITIESKGTKGGATMAEELAERARLEQERFAEEAEEANAAAAKQAEIKRIEGQIKTAEARIAEYETYIAEHGNDMTWGGGTVAFKDSPGYTSMMDEIAKYKAEIERLEAQLAAIK